MSVTTTAFRVAWHMDVPEVATPPLLADAGEGDEQLDEHAQSITTGEAPEPDPDARIRWALVLNHLTGWDFPELPTDRAYISRLWAEDWESPEDAIYDTE
jgi:hypothetical protein